MIHFTCDSCKRPIDLDVEVRYVARLEVLAAVDAGEDDADEDRDYLQELEELLIRGETVDGQPLADELYEEIRFDLCAECRQNFLLNPLGRPAAVQLGFSNN